MAGKFTLLAALLVAVAAISFLGMAFLPDNALQDLTAAEAGKAEEASIPVCFPSACINAELAETPEQRSQGLMFREHLEEGKGMLFVFETESRYSFWMKNTLIPLDIIWVGKNKKVVHIEHAVPCTTANCGSYTSNAPALYVVETNAGFAEKNGIKVGDFVEFD